MAIEVVTDYLDDATPRLIAYVYDDDDDLVDPTGITIDIYNPSATLTIDGVAMSKTATGTYEYYYHKGASVAAMAEGRWRYKVTVADGSGASTIYSIGSGTFKVR